MTGGLATSSPTTTLPLEACPDCDYALAGLPAEGVCPECGRAYDQETVVLYGRTLGGHGNLTSSTKPMLVVQIVSVAVILGSFWFVGSNRRWWILVAAAAAAYFASVLVQRRTGRRGGMSQVRINVAGCVQDDNPDDGPNTGPLRMLAEAFIAMLPSFLVMLNNPGNAFFIYFWPAALGIALVQRFLVPLPAANRRRRMMADLPGGPALMPAWRGWWTPAPVPWSAVVGFTFEPLPKPKPGAATHELVIRAKAPWWRAWERRPVNLFVHSTPEQASELASRIVAWREFARQAKSVSVKKS